MGRKGKGFGLMQNSYYDGYGDDYYHHHTSYKAKKGWDTGDAPKVCTDCSFIEKDKKQKILVNHDTWRALMAICAQVKIEWQALLTGTIDADGVVHVTGYFIPKQEVTGTSVKNLDLIDDVVIAEKHIVAGVHSHGTMACFFSATDVEDTNMSLIKHNIVVNNEEKYKAQTRIELPCGLVKFIEAEVYTVGEPDVTVVGIENIEEKKFSGFITDTTPYKSPFNMDKEIRGGVRWCPVCSHTPEEDSGASCICWTKNHRPMLPDFTEENYLLMYGRSWELKPDLQRKYGGK